MLKNILCSGITIVKAQGMGKQPIIATQDNQAQKKLAILLCGWSFMDDHESLSETLKKYYHHLIRKLNHLIDFGRLEDKGEYERAAALAVFHQDIKRGIETLKSVSASKCILKRFSSVS